MIQNIEAMLIFKYQLIAIIGKDLTTGGGKIKSDYWLRSGQSFSCQWGRSEMEAIDANLTINCFHPVPPLMANLIRWDMSNEHSLEEPKEFGV